MLVLLVLSILGCAHVQPQPAVSSLSGSPCYDGVIANIKSSGCKRIHVTQVPGTEVTRVKCEESQRIGAWLEFTFYFVSDPEMFYRDDFVPLCADPMFFAFFVESYVLPKDDKSDEKQ